MYMLTEPLSKAAAKNKKKREAQKQKREERSSEQSEALATVSYLTAPSTDGSKPLSDNEKKIKALKKVTKD